MRRRRRAALWAGVRLAAVAALLVAGALWWGREREPDFQVDARLRLEPDGGRRPSRLTLGDEAREAWRVPVSQALRFPVLVPGAGPELRLRTGSIPLPGGDAGAADGDAAPLQLVLRLARPDGRREDLASLPVLPVWTAHAVPLPAAAGDELIVELVATAPDAAGAPRHAICVADVLLVSQGRGVDETEVELKTRVQTSDLLARLGNARAFAPASGERAALGLLGPACLPLSPGEPLELTASAIPPQGRLEVVLHVARPHPEGRVSAGRVLLFVEGEVRAAIPVDLGARPGELSLETLTSVDLSPWAGGSVDLRLRREGAENLFVGLRDLTLSAPQAVPRRADDPESTLHVVLVAVESLRADRLGCYGHAGAATPRLDSLAAHGGRWERVLAPSSWSLPNLASLLTGVAPPTHGLGLAEGRVLAPRCPTLAETAAWSGVTTALFSSGAAFGEETGLARGFETVERAALPADALVERALDWLEEARQFRCFLMLHLADPGFPHEPGAQDLARVGRDPPAGLLEALRRLDSRPGAAEALAGEVGARYDGEVAGVDRALGLLLDGLRSLGLLERTLVVVVGVQGEEFYEHGGRWHGQTLHEEVVRVPLIAAGPGVRGAGGGRFVEAEPIELVDVTRLLAKLGRLSSPERIQGRLPPPFGPVLPDPVAHAVLRPVPGVTAASLDASRSRRWLRQADAATGRASLFDLQADPEARRDLLAEPADAAEAARAAFEERSLAVAFERWMRAALDAAGPHPVRREAVEP